MPSAEEGNTLAAIWCGLDHICWGAVLCAALASKSPDTNEVAFNRVRIIGRIAISRPEET